MSKIVEFRLGKGITRKVAESENDFNKRYIEFTVRLPEGCSEEQLHEAMLRTEYIADDFLAQAEMPHVPQLDTAEINALPWKKRNKEPANPGEFAWLFGPGSRGGTEQGAEKLVDAIKKAGGKLVIGDCEYSMVKEDAFVQRRPVKS